MDKKQYDKFTNNIVFRNIFGPEQALLKVNTPIILDIEEWYKVLDLIEVGIDE